jgi:predicted Zn-ribbon and HTH transcriptional regulator
VSREEIPERAATVRHSLREMLLRKECTSRELAEALELTESETIEHLAHLERSSRRGAERLVVTPARCAACGFVFQKRERLRKPSRCPMCKKERIGPPRFTLKPG